MSRWRIDRPDHTVALYRRRPPPLTVGTGRRRYIFRGTKSADWPQAFAGIAVQLDDAGTLWRDALQLEQGFEPTKYAPDGYPPEHPRSNR